MLDYSAGFYVYRLVDPRSGLPFYVGKGCGRRAWQHELSVRAGRPVCNQRKTDKIVAILAAGLTVEVDIVEVFDSAADALNLEYHLIEADPTLTNVQEGGCGRVLRTEEVERRRKIRAARVARLKKIEVARIKAEREKARVAKVAKMRAGGLSLAVTAKDQAAVAEWFDWLEAHKFDGKVVKRKPRRRSRHNKVDRRAPSLSNQFRP